MNTIQKTAGPRRLLVNRARRVQLQGVVNAVEALEVKAGDVLAIRCDPIDVPAAQYMLNLLREYLDSHGLYDQLVLLLPVRSFEFATIDEAEMERWGWVRESRSSGAESAQLRTIHAAVADLRDKYRRMHDDMLDGLPVDPAGVRSALTKLISEINRVWPDDLSTAA